MDKNSYALGMSIAHNMLGSGLRDIVIEDFIDGLKAMMLGEEPKISVQEASKLLDKYFADMEQKQKEEMEASRKAFKAEGEAFLAANAKQEGVTELPSGLQYKVIKQGSGKKPSATSRVKCHYEGKLVSGQKFDSSYDRGEPAIFGLNQVIRGWTEGLQLMAEGSVYELYIPYGLGYGEAGSPGAIPPCSALIFKVELIEVL